MSRLWPLAPLQCYHCNADCLVSVISCAPWRRASQARAQQARAQQARAVQCSDKLAHADGCEDGLVATQVGNGSDGVECKAPTNPEPCGLDGLVPCAPDSDEGTRTLPTQTLGPSWKCVPTCQPRADQHGMCTQAAFRCASQQVFRASGHAWCIA